MAFNQIHRLNLSVVTSKARDTYGLPVVRLDDSISGKRYKTCGTGYDMVGTVLGEWFENQYQAELVKLVKANTDKLEVYSTTCPDWQKIRGLYGLTYRQGKAILDGGCGVESMLHIIESCGFEVQRSHNKKGHTTGFYIQAV